MMRSRRNLCSLSFERRRRVTGGAASERGLSLVEVTIMLAVLAVLAGAVLPVATDSVSTARVVRARNDLAQISVALVNFMRDVGPIVFDGTYVRTTDVRAGAFRAVRVLVSEGNVPDFARTTTTSVMPSGILADQRTLGSIPLWTAADGADLLDLHLRYNTRNYPRSISGPGTGWNGPYIAREVSGDPWGNRYMINVWYLRGMPRGSSDCLSCAVFVLSAGPNGVVETPFLQQISSALTYGDDLAVRIQ